MILANSSDFVNSRHRGPEPDQHSRGSGSSGAAPLLQRRRYPLCPLEGDISATNWTISRKAFLKQLTLPLSEFY